MFGGVKKEGGRAGSRGKGKLDISSGRSKFTLTEFCYSNVSCNRYTLSQGMTDESW